MIFIVLGVAACASTRPAERSRDRSVIAEAEIGTVNASSVYDVVERLRPLWLQRRSTRSIQLTTEILVVQNGSYFGPLESLRTIPAVNVREIRYADGAPAVAEVPGLLRAGRHVEAAIFVTTGGTR